MKPTNRPIDRPIRIRTDNFRRTERAVFICALQRSIFYTSYGFFSQQSACVSVCVSRYGILCFCFHIIYIEYVSRRSIRIIWFVLFCVCSLLTYWIRIERLASGWSKVKELFRETHPSQCDKTATTNVWLGLHYSLSLSLYIEQWTHFHHYCSLNSSRSLNVINIQPINWIRLRTQLKLTRLN